MIQVADYMKLLPQHVLAKFSTGRILARGFVEGFKSGDHRSPYIGTSTEFAEHREYSPGDDPRNLDWRVYGKMDRYYIKQYVEETNLRATILLDSSASMSFVGDVAVKESERGRRLSKFDYARHLAAISAYLLTRQGDAVGLINFDTQIRQQLPARSKASHLRRLLESMYATQPEGESKLADVIHQVAERIPRRSLVILISDLFDDVADLVHALHHLRHYKHELLVFHVMADEELNFPFGAVTRFRNVELLANQMDVDTQTMRREYLSQVARYKSQLKAGCNEVEAGLAEFNTNQAYEESLASFLASRMSRVGVGE